MLTWEKLGVWIKCCGYVCNVNFSKIRLFVSFGLMMLNELKIQTDFYNLSYISLCEKSQFVDIDEFIFVHNSPPLSG